MSGIIGQGTRSGIIGETAISMALDNYGSAYESAYAMVGNVGKMGIELGYVRMDASNSVSGGIYYNMAGVSFNTTFSNIPKVFCTAEGNYHDAWVAGPYSITTSGFTLMGSCDRSGGIINNYFYWMAIGN